MAEAEEYARGIHDKRWYVTKAGKDSTGKDKWAVYTTGAFDVLTESGNVLTQGLNTAEDAVKAAEYHRQQGRKGAFVYGPSKDNPHADNLGRAVVWDDFYIR